MGAGKPVGCRPGRRVEVLVSLGSVRLGRNPARRQPENPRRNHERPVRPGQGFTEHLDSAAVRDRRPRHVPGIDEVVAEGQMDYPISRLRGVAEPVQVLNRPAAHLGAESCNGLGRIIRPSQADYFMTGGNELGHQAGSDPAGCTRHENAHDEPPWSRRPSHR